MDAFVLSFMADVSNNPREQRRLQNHIIRMDFTGTAEKRLLFLL